MPLIDNISPIAKDESLKAHNVQYGILTVYDDLYHQTESKEETIELYMKESDKYEGDRLVEIKTLSVLGFVPVED